MKLPVRPQRAVPLTFAEDFVMRAASKVIPLTFAEDFVENLKNLEGNRGL